MIPPATPPTTAPMMAPRAVEPVCFPITPPAAPPAAAPMIAPFCSFVIAAHPAAPMTTSAAVAVRRIAEFNKCLMLPPWLRDWDYRGWAGFGATPQLFVAQCVDWMEPGRADCGQETEDYSHGGTKYQSDHGPLHGHVHVEVSEEGDDVSQPESHEDTDHPADIAEDHRFQEELRQDRDALGPDCLPNPDLPRPLGNGHQHDIHDADTRDEQRDDADDEGRDFHAHAHLIEPGDQALAVEELEIIDLVGLDAPLAPQHLARLLDRVPDQLRGLGPHRDVDGAREPVSIRKPIGLDKGRDRNQDVVVVARPKCRFLLVEYAHDLVFAFVDSNHLSDRIDKGEELLPQRVADHRYVARAHDVDRRDVPSEPNVMRVVLRILGCPATDGDVRIRRFTVVLHDEPEVPDLGPHQVHGFDVFPDRGGILQR